jgi:hypothetical protein
MNINSCIEKTKKTAFEGLVSTTKLLVSEKVPEKIILDAVVELYVNVIAVFNKHSTTEIFKSMDYAEKYLKAYCDDFRIDNGILEENEDEGEEEENYDD